VVTRKEQTNTGSAHPREKLAPGSVDTSIHTLCSAEVWIRGLGNRIIVAAWMTAPRRAQAMKPSTHQVSEPGL